MIYCKECGALFEGQSDSVQVCPDCIEANMLKIIHSSNDGSRLDVEQQVWLGAWVAVASCMNSKVEDCSRYASACLDEFREIFGDRKGT